MDREKLEKFYIPRTLDMPDKILFFTIRDISAFFIPLTIGILLNIAQFGIFFGCLFFYISKKVEATKISIKRLLYWYTRPTKFLLTDKLKNAPPSNIRIYR